MLNIFAYGSLMYEPVWRQVVKGRYDGQPASILGYSRYRLRGRTYPALVPGTPDTTISGMLYRRVAHDDIIRLDCFEGHWYQRIGIRCHPDRKSPVIAATYLFKPAYAHLISSEIWDAEQFAQTGIGTFLQHYRGFRP